VEITMPLNRKIPAEELTPARLWAELDDDTRRLAARSLYRGEWEDPMGRREADLAIAEVLRFREVAVRKLSADRRVDYLLRAVRPDDSLARSLLLALHLGQRKPILESFLDALEIPHEGGMIDENFDLEPPDAARLTGAVEKLRAGFPDDEVEIYLASLLAMDPETWASLAELDRGAVGQ
jgi:hypothetical protein